MVVRSYKSSDCPVLIQLFYDTVHSVNADDYSAEQLNAWAPRNVNLALWDRSFRATKTLVAEREGKIVGFANLDVDISCSMCATATLDKLYVHKDYQRQGIGRFLVKHLEQYAEKNAVRVIKTFASITAKPFFEAIGYSVVRENLAECNGVAMVNYFMKKGG